MALEHSDFLKSIEAGGLGLTPEQAHAAAQFAVILHRENENQNLTRILGTEEFVSGHLVDVLELLKLPQLGKRVLDIGTGSGVPGLLASAISKDSDRVWFLTDSEKGKAEYLESAKNELRIQRASVFHKRAEEVAPVTKPDTVIARAVGTVDKIAGWIWECSTWNTLILFKSRGWEAEWSEARRTKFGKKLTVTHVHDYSNENRCRQIIVLNRKTSG
jgi:16S rRNA (guanine527-N7)-methyltransferase